MGKKRKSSVSHKPWCWYCDREFDDEKVLITHQKAKHFKCMYCYKKLNSASGLVIHVAQIHKENINTVPNAVEGHDTPEIDIFGMEGVPADDLQRHQEGLPIVHYKRMKVSEGGLLPLLAAQKASVPDQKDHSVGMNSYGQGMAASPFPGTPFSPPLPMTNSLPFMGHVSPPSITTNPPAPISNGSPNSTGSADAASVSPPPPSGTPFAASPYLGSAPYHHPYSVTGGPPGVGGNMLPPHHSLAPYFMYGHYPPPPPPPGYYPNFNPARPPIGGYTNVNPIVAQSPPPTAVLPSPLEGTAMPVEDTSRVDPPKLDAQAEEALSLSYPPLTEHTTGKVIPGGIIVAPHLTKSMEEIRANLKSYRLTADGADKSWEE